MESNLSKYKNDMRRLIDKGQLLYYRMALDLDITGEKSKNQLKALTKKVKLPHFKEEYETWYSEAQQVIKQIIPDRLNDFKLYKE